MKTISIRQPWAWLIIHGGKNIENRTWQTKVRGRVYVHAGKGMSKEEYEDARYIADKIGIEAEFPPYCELQRGGIMGEVEIVDCVSWSDSPWFSGPYGFVLKNPKPLPFFPCKGALGFFNVEIK